jgi:hypothetical protein
LLITPYRYQIRKSQIPNPKSQRPTLPLAETGGRIGDSASNRQSQARHQILHRRLGVVGAALVVAYDYSTRRRVHAVSLWGGLFLALSFPGRIALGHTAAWLTFARWLAR